MATINENILQAKQIAAGMDDNLLKSIILDLQTQLVDMQEELNKLHEQNSYNMVFENNVYYDVKSDGTKIGPYCATCWDKDRKAIRLQNYGHIDYMNCFVCKTAPLVNPSGKPTPIKVINKRGPFGY